MSTLGDRTLEHLRRVADFPLLEGERYEIQERIGQGGMGSVYRAHDRELDRDVALKVLRSGDAELQERMRREARILALLEHPGIVPVHDVGQTADGRVWCVMKLVQGHSLAEELRRRESLLAKLRLFERICEAVAFAHARGVLHRDLKPSNVMVGAFGEVLVMDWGVAKQVDAPSSPEAPTRIGPAESGQTQAGTVLGTPGYMAPEQAAGAAVDARSDVYALGAMLAEAVGERAPARLRSIVAKARAAAPAERYDTVEELAVELRRFADGESVRAHREQPWERVARVAQRHRGLLGLFLAYLLMRVLMFWFERSGN